MDKRSLRRNFTMRKVNYASFANGINVDYDESLTPIKYSKCTYNFDYHNGKLIDGLGVDTLTIHYNKVYPNLTKTIEFPAGVYPVRVGVYVVDDNPLLTALIVYCTDSKLYYNFVYNVSGTLTEYTGITLTKAPDLFTYNLNGTNALIITNDTDGMWVRVGATTYNVSGAPKITSFCLHYERLFVTTSNEPHTLWFSDDLDPTNWNVSSTEAGFISMYDDRGPLLKVVSFGGYVYIFRQYGISRLMAYADQDNFNLTNLFVSSGQIYANSIALCGNQILFLASDGLYSFNGTKTSKIRLNIDSMFYGIDNSNCVSTYYNGCYYLACKLSFDGTTDYAVIKIDLSNGNLVIAKGINITSFASINTEALSKLVAVVNVIGTNYLSEVSMSGKVFNTATYKYWRSPASDFGLPYADKVVRELYFDSKGSVQVIVNIDGVDHSYSFSGDSLTSKRIKVNLRGNKIAVNFAATGSGVMISNPQLLLGY